MVFRQDQIRPPGELAIVQAVAEPACMQALADISSGFVSLPLIAAMLRLRVARSWTSGIAQERDIFCRSQMLQDVRTHNAGDFPEYRHSDRVAELLVGLGIGNRDAERVRVAHQAGAFSGCQAARILTCTAADKNFRTILVIAGR
jgi:hypothetical protein